MGDSANATTNGTNDFALAVGEQASASATGGDNNLAIAIGNPDTPPDVLPLAVAPNKAFSLVAVRRATTAVAGAPRLIARAAAPTGFAAVAVSYNNNTAIAIGNGTAAGAGLGSNNSAAAIGNRDTANAFSGDNNTAIVLGTDSLARAFGGNQTATAVGNGVVGGGPPRGGLGRSHVLALTAPVSSAAATRASFCGRSRFLAPTVNPPTPGRERVASLSSLSRFKRSAN
jgi:hypothetical protein